MLIIQTTPAIAVQFEHPVNPNGTRSTVCRIYKDISGSWAEKPCAVGTTTCSKSDNFNKAVGRKYALSRALLDNRHIFSKPTRKAIWETYREMCR